MIFQDALSSLNPVHRVGDQIAEMLVVHRGVSRREARRRAVELMDRVRIPSAADAGRTTSRTSSPAACGSGS